MRIVVDTNKVFSAMLHPHGAIGDILLNSHKVFEFLTGNSLREEIENHRTKIMALAGYDEAEYEEIKFQIFNRLTFIAEPVISFEFWSRAADYVRDVDMDDISFVALSLFLDCKFWTGDKRLIKGLENKGFPNLITTQEIQEILQSGGVGK